MSAPASRGGGWLAAQMIFIAAIAVAGPKWAGGWTDGGASGVAALVLQLAAFTIIAAALPKLGCNLTPFPRPKAGAHLVTDGIYGWVRHPLYIAVMLTAVAWALWWRSIGALSLLPPFLVFMDAKARREEKWLREKFHGYEAYANRVKRFVPGVY
jgi:protein-S-isoprenylcysteine O-methyltransferase Ste14